MSLQLPEKLDLDGSYEEMMNALYTVFSNDVKNHSLRYNGLRIVFDNRRIDSEYEEGFWHIITRTQGERLLDYKRAKRLPWLKPIIENPTDEDILLWTETVANKKGRRVNKTYLWYRDGKYLIVLKEIPKKYFLTTAFYVNGTINDQKYWRRYQNAQ